jgi:hypothetical protein
MNWRLALWRLPAISHNAARPICALRQRQRHALHPPNPIGRFAQSLRITSQGQQLPDARRLDRAD